MKPNDPVIEKIPVRFKPRLLNHPLTYPWLLLVICMLMGALLGYLSGLLKEPIYEARALITTNMELVQTTRITEIMVDAEVDHVGTLLYHPDIIQALIDLEKEQGNPVSLESLKQNSSIERRLMDTIIKVRNSDPTLAARIASEWAQISFDRLQKAYPFAAAVSTAKQQLLDIDNCINNKEKLDAPFCRNLTADQASQISAEAVKIIADQSPYTLGLTSALNVSQFQPAAIPNEPLWFGRGVLILAGVFIGFITGIIVNEVIPLKKNPDEDRISR